jgi:hypothetical protein
VGIDSPGEKCGHWKGDSSLRSFLFTLRNPHGVPPRKFALRAEGKWCAICCYSVCCAAFGWNGDCDIRISDTCNANKDRDTCFGTRWSDRTDANDTAFRDFFTVAKEFTVKGIEVFEIADSMALPADSENARMDVYSERARDAGCRLLQTAISRWAAGGSGRQTGGIVSRKAVSACGGFFVKGGFLWQSLGGRREQK